MVMAGHSNHAASSLLTILTSFLLLKIWLWKILVGLRSIIGTHNTRLHNL
jgi:hypothetical protein